MGNYVALLDPNNRIHVVPDNQYAAHTIKRVSPQKVWKFSIKPRTSQVDIPGATPQEKNDILLAYYRNWGLDVNPDEGLPIHNDEYPDASEYIDAPILDKDYEQKTRAYLAKAKQAPFQIPKGGTRTIRSNVPEPETTDF